MDHPTAACSKTTLIFSTQGSPRRRWQTRAGGSRVVLVRDMTVFEEAVAAMDEFDNYIDRIIMDHAGSDHQLLMLLQRVPETFQGQILIARSGWSSLSVWNSKEGRKLYRLNHRDVESYLQNQSLTVPAAAAPMSTAA